MLIWNPPNLLQLHTEQHQTGCRSGRMKVLALAVMSKQKCAHDKGPPKPEKQRGPKIKQTQRKNLLKEVPEHTISHYQLSRSCSALGKRSV